MSALLTVLIMACPTVCGAAEAAHLARGHHAASSPTAPAHCPEDSDNCICHGAVQSSVVPLPHSDPGGLPHFLHVPTDVLAHRLAFLTSDGHPATLGGRGGSRIVRALLQSFRC